MPRQRIANDFYPTPAFATQSLLSVVSNLPLAICEPCSGEDAITSVLRQWNRCVYATDIVNDPSMDATTPEYWQHVSDTMTRQNVKLWATVTNPPFSLAPQILPLAWEHSTWGIAMLLRLSYLEACANRQSFLTEQADHMRLVQTINPRIKFREDVRKSDSVTVAWMVWEKSFSWREHGLEPPFQFIHKSVNQ